MRACGRACVCACAHCYALAVFTERGWTYWTLEHEGEQVRGLLDKMATFRYALQRTHEQSGEGWFDVGDVLYHTEASVDAQGYPQSILRAEVVGEGGRVAGMIYPLAIINMPDPWTRYEVHGIKVGDRIHVTGGRGGGDHVGLAALELVKRYNGSPEASYGRPWAGSQRVGMSTVTFDVAPDPVHRHLRRATMRLSRDGAHYGEIYPLVRIGWDPLPMAAR